MTPGLPRKGKEWMGRRRGGGRQEVVQHGDEQGIEEEK
jgi:hypothetical protein